MSAVTRIAPHYVAAGAGWIGDRSTYDAVRDPRAEGRPFSASTLSSLRKK